MLTSTVTVAAPVFVKYGDMIHDEKIHILLFAIINEITSNQAVVIQKYRSFHKLHVKEESAKEQLIENGLITLVKTIFSDLSLRVVSY